MDEMKDRPWLSIQPRKLRQGLDELLSRLKQLPSQYRSYQSYDFAKNLLQNYSKVCGGCSRLCTLNAYFL